MNYIFLLTVLAVVLGVIIIASFTNFSLDNYHYDRLKWLVIRWSYIVIFVALLVKTFDFPYGTETVVVVAGIGAVLARFLGVSNKNYNEEKMTQMLNQDLLKDMLGYGQDLHLMGEVESESEEEEEETEVEEESEE